MNTGWSLIDNPFEISTQGNYSKMLKISNFTDSALKAFSADPFFLNLYNEYHPIHELYLEKESQRGMRRGKQMGGTLNVKQLLKQLSNPNIGRWATTIRNQYPINTERYKSLLARGAKPFHNGSREMRISAVGALARSIGSDANLVALKAEVDAFYQLLDSGRSTQLGGKYETKNSSNQVEAQRNAVAVALMKLYGNLVVHFADKLEQIELFFDLETLRDKRQKVFTRHIKPGKSKTIVKRTLLPESEVKIKNTGATPLLVCVTSSKSMVCETGFISSPHSEAVIPASQLGDVTQLKFITLTNNTEAEGSCVIMLM